MADEIDRPNTGKLWNIKPENVKFSMKDILSRLFQYSNIADAAAHINSQMEYVIKYHSSTDRLSKKVNSL